MSIKDELISAQGANIALQAQLDCAQEACDPVVLAECDGYVYEVIRHMRRREVRLQERRRDAVRFSWKERLRARAAEAKLARVADELQQIRLWCLHSEPLFSSRQGTALEATKRARASVAAQLLHLMEKEGLAEGAEERLSVKKP